MVVAGYKQQIPLAVRTSTQNPADLYRYMDLGISMFVLPRIESAEQCKRLVSGIRYAPYGERGLGGPVRANDWGALPLKQQMEEAAQRTLVMVQIESQSGVDRADEILDVDGVDIVFIGPLDLSQALGVPGEVGSPTVQNTISELVQKIKNKGLVAGLHVADQEQAAYWFERGVQYFTVGMDVAILRSAGKSLVENLQGTNF
jgi:2-keto-3-deoxy-L-rhamnonate aldolase RhmA